MASTKKPSTIVQLDSRSAKMMHTMGVPRDLLSKRPYNLAEHVISWRSEIDGMISKNIRKQAQLDCFLRLSDRPFYSPYTIAISAHPNDAKAKQLAAMLICKAATQHLRNVAPRAALRRELPLWHTLLGGWHDKVRDAPDDARPKPSLLVLSNLTDDSTNVKLEKARDLLELYNDIPKILVISTKDPRAFVNTRLYSEVNDMIQVWTAKVTSL